MYRNTTSDPLRPITLASGQPLAPGEDGPADPDLDWHLIDAGDLTRLDVSDDFAAWVTGHTIAEILERVGDDPDLRAQALTAENASETPRTSLLKQLQTPSPDQETT